jgi:hypothetical protein
MEALKERDAVSGWNDDRLDELATDVKAGFAKVDKRFEKVEGEMKEGFAAVDKRFEKVEGEMKAGFAKVDARFEKVDQKIDEKFERLYHVLIAGMVVIVGALVGVPAIGG